MHPNSLKLLRKFLKEHPADPAADRVLDVGSYDVNGTYRADLEDYGYQYTGLDERAGPNVDLVMFKAPWVLDDPPYDLVVSGQTLEHCENPFELVYEMGRALRQGGPLVLIAPFQFPEHRFPIDCWRFLPDGMNILLKHAGCVPQDAFIHGEDCFAWGIKL